MKSILLNEKFLGLVEMTSGLVNASFSLPEWQAVKMIFFAPCITSLIIKGTFANTAFITLRSKFYYRWDLYFSYVNLIYMYFLLSSQLVLYTENMFYHLTQLVEDRDNCIGVSILYSGGL